MLEHVIECLKEKPDGQTLEELRQAVAFVRREEITVEALENALGTLIDGLEVTWSIEKDCLKYVIIGN